MENIYRRIKIINQKCKVDLNNLVARYKFNPLLKSSEVNKIWDSSHLKVVTVHNAGVIEYEEKVLMLFRSHLRNGISVIGLAESKNGVDKWKIFPKPVIKPCTRNDVFYEGVDIEECIISERGGCEDPRISKIGDTFYITYSAYHASIKNRVRVSLITTKDFISYVRHGALMDIDMRNVVIFPEKIDNKFFALFRPNDSTKGDVGGIFKQILIGNTDNILEKKWNINQTPIINQLGGPSAFADKIGPGATPIKSKYGWINIFHGVRNTMDGNPYVLGVAIHDLENPEKVKVANIPILFPTKSDCKVKSTDYVHVPNVVFCCGALRKSNGELYIYYGGNDTVMNLCVTHEDILFELCQNFPQDPNNGTYAYEL